MSKMFCMLLVIGALGVAAACCAAESSSGCKQGERFFELRTYTTHPGKLDALHKRFREHTNRIFKKHGMQLVGFWTPVEGPESENTLIYILAFPASSRTQGRQARDKAWEAFRNDPQWQKAFKESRADGPIVKKVQSQFISPTDYSPIR